MSQTSDTSQQTAPICALGLTSADLSAWRDETLAPDETARIGAHSEGCLACQQRLRGFALVAATLQAQPIPVPDERLWQAVLAALSAGERTTSADAITGEYLVRDESDDGNPITRPHTPPRSWRRRALGTLAAVAAIALVVVGFGRVFQFGAQNRPPQPFSLTWRQISLPGGMGATLDASAPLSVFARDGSIAWICQSGTEAAPGPLRIWRTTNAGTTWRSMEAPQLTRAFDCQIQLDQLDSGVAVVDLKAYAHPNQNQATSASFATVDGGTHWQDNPTTLSMTGFATLNGATYAIQPGDNGVNRLLVSNDEMKTWSIFDDVIHNKHLRTMKFWLHPVTGALLVEAFPVDGAIVSLWTTDASGRDWQQLTTPLLAEPILNPAADGSWDVCSMFIAPESEQQPRTYTNRVTCGSTKAGNWTTRPGLSVASPVAKPTSTDCDGCVQLDANGQTYQLALATDGAVLAMYSYRFTYLGLPTWSDIYRLPAGSTQWQKGGKLPEGAAFYAPRPDGGILWSMPATAPDGLGNLAGPVFTASYPGPAAPPLPTQAPTPTLAGNVTQNAPLAWQPITNPAGFQPRLTSANVLAVAPSDGRTAYACAQPNMDPPAAQVQGWATHDGGASWSSLALPQVTGWCSLVVDEVDPRDLLLGIAQNPPAGGTTLPDRYYRSIDGGTTWQHISGLDGSVVYQFASHGSAIYALRVENPLSDTATAKLQASADGMATWRTVDGALHSGQSGVGQFWLNPYNGELLATNVPPSGVTTSTSMVVWRSGDGGAHWSNLKAPAYGFTSVIVRPPQLNHAWDICVSDFTASPTTAPSNLLYCGDDSGQGWHDVTGLDTGDTTATPHYAAFTSDGALLAINMAATSSGATTYNVYRLPSGANHWQALGPTSEFSLLYAPTATGDGMLWSAPVNGISAPINGNASDPQGRVFAVAAP